VVNTTEVPGHTAHSTLFFLQGQDLVFTGDAIGSGSGVWLFNYESLPTYSEGIDKLIGYVADPANQINPEQLEIHGGHAWQRGELERLTIQYVYDIDTGERRPTDHEDIEKAARLCDYLPNIDFVMPMGMTAGVDPASRGMNPNLTDRYDFAAMLRNTTKPLMCSCWTVDGLSDIYEMAVAVRGSEQNFQNNPFFISFRQPVSPLRHDAEPLRAILYCADKGIPMCYASYPLMGATGPATLAGSFALSNAEFLSGLSHPHRL